MATDREPVIEPSLPGFVQLAAEVERCGWRLAEERCPAGDVRFRTFQGSHLAQVRCFASEGGPALLLVGLESVRLPGEEELFPRFLDLSLEERMALTFARVQGETDWLLLQTQGRIDLIRLAGEINEWRVEQAGDYEGGLLPTLTALARGRDRARGGARRPLPGAESLGGWIRHWSLQLAAVLEAPADVVERVIWKWILMLQAARRVDGCETLSGAWGLHCERDDEGWTLRYDAISATGDLCRALEDCDEVFVTRLLETGEYDIGESLRRLEETPLIDRLRAELLMHSQYRFEPETVSWLFSDLVREQEGWRREVRGVEPVRRRLHMEGWTVYRPMVCDVGRYGLSAALGDVDRLADHLNELNLFARQRNATRQPDLFRPNPRGIGPTGQLDDGLNFLLGETLRLRGVESDERLGVGLTLLLKALALAPRVGWPFLGIDTLDEIFSPAP